MSARWTAILLLWAWAALSHAAPPEPRPFVQGSMKEVAGVHAGKPFILAFWSLSCVHCKANLELFGKLLQRYPQMPLVLVSTDSPEEGATIKVTLEKYGLDKPQTWVFADRFVERLYFEIDRRWRGELPRTYLYEASHQARTLTGKLDMAETERWLQSLPGR
jgi:thiol-disulfide isomerase/thioredoxin